MLAVRALALVAVAGLALVAGIELRSAREAFSQVASASTPTPTAVATWQATAGPVRTVAPGGVSPAPTPIATAPPSAPAPKSTTAPASTIPATLVHTITGRVMAGTTPVTHAELRVYPADAQARGPTPVPPTSARAHTDPRGGYTLQLPAGTYRVGAYLDAGAPEEALGFHWVTWYGDAFAIGLGRDLIVKADAGGVDISMLRSVRISGRVLGPDGVGVAAAQVGVFFEAPGPWPDKPYPWELASARTDATGAWSTRVVPMTATKVSAVASGNSAPAYAVVTADIRTDTSGITVTIDRGRVLSGTLRDVGGAALPNRDFMVVSDAVVPGQPIPNGTAICAYSCTGRTDAFGHYAVTVPVATLRFITAASPTLTSKAISVTADASMDVALGAK